MYEEENFVRHKIKEWRKEYSTSPLENDMLRVIFSIYSFPGNVLRRQVYKLDCLGVARASLTYF